MRLSDAMLAGSLITEMQKCDINRCALGAALNAVGQPESAIASRYQAVSDIWPWLDQSFPTPLRINSYDVPYYQGLVMCYFDHYVSKLKTMTFEELVHLVRIMEPDCGDCNQFNCTCQPVQLEPAPEAESSPLTLA